MSLSQHDETLSELMDKFGAEGYGVWWIVLEKIAQLMDETGRCFARFSVKVWATSAKVSAKKFQNIVEFLEKKSTFILKNEDNFLTIECPNLLKYRDEWTDKKAKAAQKNRDKLPSDSRVNTGVTPNFLRHDPDTDPDTEDKEDITTSNSAIHSLGSKFFALFAADGFYIDKVNGNPDTVGMVRAWIAAGVTVEEAKIVIEQKKAKRGGKHPTSPSYYRDIVLDAKRAGIVMVDKNFQEEIKKLFHKILPGYPINVWTDKAAQDLQARINTRYEKFDFKKIKTWRNFFLIVKCSTHIKQHEWHLDYLIREEVFANILNNKRQVDLEQYEKLKQQYSTEEEK